MIKSIKQKEMNKKVVKKYFLTALIVSMGPTNYILFTMVLRRKFSTFYNTLRCKWTIEITREITHYLYGVIVDI